MSEPVGYMKISDEPDDRTAAMEALAEYLADDDDNGELFRLTKAGDLDEPDVYAAYKMQALQQLAHLEARGFTIERKG